MSKIFDMEKLVAQGEDKYKEQLKINSELADKIQQLEFDKDMLDKENENLKKREYDFKGLLDSGELEAQIQFKDQELAEYKKKLDEERIKNAEYISDLKDDMQSLKKTNL